MAININGKGEVSSEGIGDPIKSNWCRISVHTMRQEKALINILIFIISKILKIKNLT